MFIANAHSEERVIELINGVEEKRVLGIRGMLEGEHEGKGVRINETVHTMRHMGEVAFVILCKSRGLVQCICEAGGTDFDIRDLKEESAVEVMGVVKTEERTPQDFKIGLKEIRVLSRLVEPLPPAVNKWKLNTSLGAKLSLRPISLCNVRERVKFRTQEGVVRELRDYPLNQGFTKIRTPKVVARGTEGGFNVFKLEYFNKKAELGQGPQFHEQTMVGVCGRMFEVTPVSRAEKHNITRHLSEYASLDFEMEYIDNFRDAMDTEMGMLQYVMRLLEQEYKKELDTLGVVLLEAGRILAARLDQAEELVSRKYDKEICNPCDLEPEEELLIRRYFKEKYGSDFVFVMHYLSKKRPFYVMDDPEDPRFALDSDLMFRRPEMTIGGQGVHSYREITDKMEEQDMDPEDTASYLMIFRYGMPPHGGLDIGLGRLTMRLLDEQNVRETSMLLRDVTKLGLQRQGND